MTSYESPLGRRHEAPDSRFVERLLIESDEHWGCGSGYGSFDRRTGDHTVTMFVSAESDTGVHCLYDAPGNEVDVAFDGDVNGATERIFDGQLYVDVPIACLLPVETACRVVIHFLTSGERHPGVQWMPGSTCRATTENDFVS